VFSEAVLRYGLLIYAGFRWLKQSVNEMPGPMPFLVIDNHTDGLACRQSLWNSRTVYDVYYHHLSFSQDFLVPGPIIIENPSPQYSNKFESTLYEGDL
jgi:hypothetical protein